MSRPLVLMLAAGACLLSFVAAAGDGKGDGKSRAGRQDCGNELMVVLPDGTRRQYVPAASLLAAVQTVMIDQGEQPRQAVKVSDLLGKLGGTWIEALDCDNKSVRMPAGLPFEGEEYLVITGRGSFKVVREVRAGRYTNVAQGIRKLTLHAPAVESGTTRR